MSEPDDLRQLAQQAPVVVFHSPVTDLGSLDRELDRAGIRWQAVEMTMASQASRDLFHQLRHWTGHPTLPQVFRDGRFLGGLEQARTALTDVPPLRPAAALWMGYLGLLPFAAGAAGAWLGLPGSAQALAAYGAVILCFVGAMHWGVAALRPGDPGSRGAFLASVVPALVAWGALLLPAGPGSLALLAVSFPAWLTWERHRLSAPLPPWLRRLRLELTAGATLALAVGAASWLV